MDDSEDETDRLIGLVYEAVIDAGAWQRLVNAIDRHLDGVYVQMHAHDQLAKNSLGGVYTRHPEEFMQSYFDYYGQFNPIASRIGSVPVGRIVRTEELVDMDTLVRSEYYNEWFLPQEDSAIGCGLTLLRDSNRLLIAGVHLRAKDVESKMDASQALLHRLKPHLVRAMNMRRAMAGIHGSGEALRASLDEVADAVFHLDARGRVAWANRSAEALCQRVTRLRIDAMQKLRTGDSALDTHIAELCQRRFMQVLPIVIDCRAEVGALLVGHAMAAPDLSTQWDGLEREVATVVTLHLPAWDRDWQRVVEHFGLTAAEAALADALVHGATLEQCAAQRGTSVHTVRGQLRALLAKTGTNRQSEVVGLLAPFATAGRA